MCIVSVKCDLRAVVPKHMGDLKATSFLMGPIKRGLQGITTGASYNIYSTLHKKEKSIPNTGIAAFCAPLELNTSTFSTIITFFSFIYNLNNNKLSKLSYIKCYQVLFICHCPSKKN